MIRINTSSRKTSIPFLAILQCSAATLQVIKLTKRIRVKQLALSPLLLPPYFYLALTLFAYPICAFNSSVSPRTANVSSVLLLLSPVNKLDDPSITLIWRREEEGGYECEYLYLQSLYRSWIWVLIQYNSGLW